MNDTALRALKIRNNIFCKPPNSYIRMIFLGETFSGFVTVHNDSQDMVKEVSLKVCTTLH